ncbi:FAS1-like dehydratase domain-containing protein [Cribrihabitans pelagius]|uniref:FAS1-like dehydratase domain-containing protein n=1 Tax=Cribrihabitans pelagius TaxID=1765746 RepID=UPI003B5928D8
MTSPDETAPAASQRETCLSDVMDPARAAAFQTALGLQPDIAKGSVLPPFFHQLYFWTPLPPAALGRDGHPRVGGGGLIPDLGLPRRMWAGGRLRFAQPLRAGHNAEKRSVLEKAGRKTGRSGPLGFVTLRHEIRQAGALCLTEWHDLVYREDPEPGAPAPVPPAARTDEAEARAAAYSSALLFRYSALTFNGHRIHYDLDYAQGVEGYGGLVVHGPLLAQQLMLMAEEALGPLAEFSFRATSPLMHTERAELCRQGRDFWVRGPDGRECMRAEAVANG